MEKKQNEKEESEGACKENTNNFNAKERKF